MKVGDTIPVMIAGQEVVRAKVTEMGDGTATLLIPGTIAVMSVRTELAPPEPVEGETEHVITGVEAPVQAQEAPKAENAPQAPEAQNVPATETVETSSTQGTEQTEAGNGQTD